LKKLMPVLIAFLGLAVGLGAGLALKPEPEETASACSEHAPGAALPPGRHEAPAAEASEASLEASHGVAPEAGGQAAADPCAEAADAFAAASTAEHPSLEGALAYVPMDKPFVVPIFRDDKVTAMVVVSLSVETEAHDAPVIEGLKPRLRDSFLKVMFRHANSGGFDGSFTGGRKMEDLKAALHAAARDVLHDKPVGEVLITEIARQDS
jgi:flagellar protein FliL